MRVIIFIVLFCFQYLASGQGVVDIEILYEGDVVSLERGYGKEGISFSTIKFYLSNIYYGKRDTQEGVKIKEYHLFDLSDATTHQITFETKKITGIDQFHFTLGIDSTVNAGGVRGGDLDPRKNMYWTWQSGYINTKIEGVKFTNSMVEEEIVLHLGGFLQGFISAQDCSRKVSSSHIKLVVDLGEYLKGLGEDADLEIMSPGPQAVEYSTNLAKCMKVISL